MASRYDQRIYEAFDPFSNLKQEEQLDTLVVFLPGFSKEHIKVQLDDRTNTLKISGERSLGENNKWRWFNKELSLPGNCNINELRAKFENGVLHIFMPKIVEDNLQQKPNEVPASKPKPAPRPQSLPSQKPKPTSSSQAPPSQKLETAPISQPHQKPVPGATVPPRPSEKPKATPTPQPPPTQKPVPEATVQPRLSEKLKATPTPQPPPSQKPVPEAAVQPPPSQKPVSRPMPTKTPQLQPQHIEKPKITSPELGQKPPVEPIPTSQPQPSEKAKTMLPNPQPSKKPVTEPIPTSMPQTQSSENEKTKLTSLSPPRQRPIMTPAPEHPLSQKPTSELKPKPIVGQLETKLTSDDIEDDKAEKDRELKSRKPTKDGIAKQNTPKERKWIEGSAGGELKESYKDGSSGVAMESEEKTQLVKNIGAAILVIVALGVYVTYNH